MTPWEREGELPQRFIVVPSLATRAWIEREVLQKSQEGICTGFRFVYLKEALQIIAGQRLKLLGFTEVAWALNQYLQTAAGEELSLGLKEEEEKEAMSLHLGQIFLDYQSFGPDLLREWLEGAEKGIGQQAIWQALFAEQKERMEAFVKPTQENTEWFFIGWNFLPQAYLDVLLSLEKSNKVFLFLHTPSQVPWIDTPSLRQQHWLQRLWKKRGVQQEEVIQAQSIDQKLHPLLAGCGELAKSLLSFAADQTWMQEVYLAPKWLEERLYLPEDIIFEEGVQRNLLTSLQSDLLLMEEAHSSDDLSQKDFSIQCHVAPNKLREVQALYDSLCRLFHEQESLCTEDVLIMAPNPQDYITEIQTVFEADESIFSIDIQELPLEESHCAFAMLFQWVSLLQKGESSILWLLLRHPQLCAAKDWESSQLSALLSSHLSLPEVDTGEHVIEQLIRSLEPFKRALFSKGEDSSILPYPLGDEEAALCLKLILFINHLAYDLKFIKQKHTADEWHQFFLQRFLEDFTPEKPTAECEDVLQFLQDPFPRLSLPGKVSFPFIWSLYRRSFLAKASQLSTKSGAIRFSSFHGQRAIPAKIVALLGLTCDHFPRKPVGKSLDMLSSIKKPTVVQEDRYLFLESLLSAGEVFILCYADQELKSPLEGGSSSLLTDLFQSLDRAYKFEGGKRPSEHCTFVHPHCDYADVYFTDPRYQTFSSRRFSLAKSRHVKQEKQESLPVIECEKEKKFSISLQSVEHALKYPPAVFLQKAVGINLSKDWLSSPLRPIELALTALDRYLVRDALWIGNDTLIKHQVEQLQSPIRTYLFREIEKELQERADFLVSQGTSAKQLFWITFDRGYAAPIKKQNRWFLPPLRLERESQPLYITGEIGPISPEGLIVEGKERSADLFTAWPRLLSYLELVKQYPELGLCPNFFFWKMERLDPPQELGRESLLAVLNFTDQLINFCPFLPDFWPLVMQGDVEKLQKKWMSLWKRASMGYWINPYLEFAIPNPSQFPLDHYMRRWQAPIQKAFSHLFLGGNRDAGL